MSQLVLDRSRKLDVVVRNGEAIDKTISALNAADRSSFEFGYSQAEMLVYRTIDGKKPIDGFDSVLIVPVILTTGSIHLIDTRLVDLLPAAKYIYFFWLTNQLSVRKLWLNGLFRVNHGTFDGEDETDEIIINPDGTPVIIEITGLNTEIDGGSPERLSNRIKLRRGTAAEWTTSNPTLADGEFGWEKDTKKWKIGDGTTAWSDLEYQTTTINEIQSVLEALNPGDGDVLQYRDGALEWRTLAELALDLQQYLLNP